EQDRLDDAVAAYQKAVELRSDLPGLRFSLAEVLRDAERYDEAISIYRTLADELRASEDEQDEDALAESYAGLAASLNLAGRYDEALTVSGEFLQRFPDQAEALYEKASAYDALGRHQEAIASYERAHEADPLNPTICNDLADTYLAVGRPADAVEMAETAVSLDPDLAIGYETLAQALTAAGRTAEAQDALNHAAELRAAEQADADASDDPA